MIDEILKNLEAVRANHPDDDNIIRICEAVVAKHGGYTCRAEWANKIHGFIDLHTGKIIKKVSENV